MGAVVLSNVTAIVVATAVIGVTAAPLVVMTPPLKVGEGTAQHRTARVFLSATGEAGRVAYQASCAECHGTRGRGGSAPALRHADYARDFRLNERLHSAVSADIPEHQGLRSALGRPGGKARFNQVEMMGSYLRELARAENLKSE